MTDDPSLGRRELKKADKQARIMAAARELLGERTYDEITTQDIADRADVAIGTLFRYVANKDEILLMISTDAIGRMIDAYGDSIHDAIEAESDTEHRMVALLDPFVAAASRTPVNAAHYVRCIMFSEEGEYHDLAIADLKRLEDKMVDILTAPDAPPLRDSVTPHEAARIILSSIAMRFVAIAKGRDDPATRPEALRHRVEVLLRGMQRVD